MDHDVFPDDFVVVRGPVALAHDSPDLAEWATRIAQRCVPAEMLCRLRIQRITAERDIAL